MKYKGIIFDKDGTLIDFNKTWLPIYRYAALEFAHNNQQIAADLLGQHGYDHLSGRFLGSSLLAAGSNREIAEAWLQQLPDIAGHTDLDAMSERLHQIFVHQGKTHSVAVDGLKTTLTILKQAGLKLGVATSDSYQGIHSTLHSFDVIDDFDFLCGYDSGHGIKPGPGMVLAFCDEMSLPPEEVIVIGDNLHDIEMGKSAGVGLCIGVLTGTSTYDELDTLADIVLSDICSLPGLIGID